MSSVENEQKVRAYESTVQDPVVFSSLALTRLPGVLGFYV